MKKVLVALSGGVDSAVSCLILKKQKFQVSAGYIDLSKDSKKKEIASKVASFLDVPFFSFDFSKEFQEKIVSCFIEKYRLGLTPNPCVDCNKEIKFDLFLKKALSLNFDYIATGHYAINRQGKIFKGKDKNKDQSYFLWRLRKQDLKRIIFPLGEYFKKEVKVLGQKIPHSKESQEVCFVKENIDSFLEKKIKKNPGLIVDDKGKVLGQHQGLFFYTIGQRRKINLPNGPYFVVNKDIKKNILFVSLKNDFKKQVFLEKINWLGDSKDFTKVSVRYRQEPVSGRLEKNKLIFKTPQKNVASGQSAVFYYRNQLLGGGIIK